MASYDRSKRHKSHKARTVVDTLGHLLALALVVRLAHEQGRDHVEQLAPAVQEAAGERVELPEGDGRGTRSASRYREGAAHQAARNARASSLGGV